MKHIDPDHESEVFVPFRSREEEINNLHSTIISFAQKTLDHAIRIGRLLEEKRDELPHGEYLPWLKKNIDFSPDTAENYRRIFKHRDEVPWDKITSLRQALGFLKKVHALAVPPDPVVKRSLKNQDECRFEAQAAAKEKAQLVQNLGIAERANDSLGDQGTGPIEKEIALGKQKEDKERAKILQGIREVLERCRDWSTEEYHDFLVDLAGIIDRQIKEMEDG